MWKPLEDPFNFDTSDKSKVLKSMFFSIIMSVRSGSREIRRRGNVAEITAGNEAYII